MKVEVLLSCMHQTDFEIIKRTNIQSNAIVVNQSDKETEEFLNPGQETSRHGSIRIITTLERGLSKSRNRALQNATCDLCLLCDDDEILFDNYPEIINNAFKENPQADVIAFQIRNAGKIYPKSKKKIGYIGALKLASWQLAFRRKSIIEHNIKFDETLGSGVSKAGGEENMFIYDCLKNKLNVIFVPVTIGQMIESESQWFHGYTPEYFFDRGIMTRKLMGKTLALLYAIYFLLKKYPLYHKDIKTTSAIKNIFKGLFS